ncbi:hypothetical protein AK812_SmicGene9673 [Symbiodinium microadriaticum]|uniref:Uncharacterized protein n=1 Tax=Symbiodinium microadriaticum TaxID=2951 RepID=A0A1Q9EHV6_SYMMI|nr:hypothetical protein AK812_SmicGene9673 [Symbiodinium microadriaticum]
MRTITQYCCQPIADTPLLLGGHHEMHIAAGEEVALQWEQPLEEGAYWAWVWRIARTPVEPGFSTALQVESSGTPTSPSSASKDETIDGDLGEDHRADTEPGMESPATAHAGGCQVGLLGGASDQHRHVCIPTKWVLTDKNEHLVGYVPLSHIEPLKAQREAEETRRMADELRQQAIRLSVFVLLWGPLRKMKIV